MNHPLFHVGETCQAHVPASTGSQWMECEIMGPLTRRSVRDLDNRHLGYALSYKVLLDGATRECLFLEGDLRKQFDPCGAELSAIWQPKREAR